MVLLKEGFITLKSNWIRMLVCLPCRIFWANLNETASRSATAPRIDKSIVCNLPHRVESIRRPSFCGRVLRSNHRGFALPS